MPDPYCGPAPLPAELWMRWNFDPPLLMVLALLAMGHAALLRGTDHGPVAPHRIRGFAVLWLLAVALFVSPLCALTSALFSARIAHHMALVAIAAPLQVFTLPPRLRDISWPPALPAAAAMVHAVLLWLWHAPAPYAAALADSAVFWAMEASLFGSALLLWSAILSRRTRLASSLGALLATVVQTGLLGAAITFARTPLYDYHIGSTTPWGLSALADQQLAGLIMWVPAAVPYLFAALALTTARLLQTSATGETPT